MIKRWGAGLGWLLALLTLGGSAGPVLAAGGPMEATEFFEKKIRPVLAKHCYGCHSARAKKLRGGLRLDGRAALLRGGDSGPAVEPGRPEKSRLVAAVSYKDVDLQMPPAGKLPAAVLADLTAWVKMGAPWPGPAAGTSAGGGGRFDLARRKREHWSWRPVRPQPPPTVRRRGWVRSPSDAFILARLEAAGIQPAPEADKRTLLRRVYFDLLGLPPAPADVEAFVKDGSPAPLERVVDRLLASPRFGERWGRHWLDLVRYAETRGHEFDYPIPNAYHYRDYVIRALNADLPYDQFVTEHLAGDLLPKPRRHPVEGFNESILGTAWWFLGEEVHSPVDVRGDQADRFDNRLDVFGKTFLGLTVACARCHDHKFDAISTADYYALFGFLASSSYRLARFDSMEHNRRVAEELWALRKRAGKEVRKALGKMLSKGVGRTADYLLAAREAKGNTSRDELNRLAAGWRLDAAVLGRWVAHLAHAVKDSNDPLYPWAAQTAGAEGWRKRDAATRAGLRGAEVVIDYSASRPEQWLPDGVAFGAGPARPGDVRLTADAGEPAMRVVTAAAAEYDRTWDVLHLAPGAENDPGSLGAIVRAGRTLRTPTFRLNGGKLFYLVKGTGLAYASVGAHVMIAGPLHGQLVQRVQAGNQFRWVAHDLSAYRGQRVHVEFTGAERSDFAVAMVVQAANAPAATERPNSAVLKLLDGAPTPEALGSRYERLFQDVVARLADDRLRGAQDVAALADWMLRHGALFGLDGAAVAKAAAPWRTAEADLARRIRRDSRLTPALLDGSGEDEHVFIRGSHKAPGTVAPRRLLEALAGSEPLAVARGSGRLELARQMTDPARNPYLARVMVNRVWHHLFGRGLVASVDNFGVMGEAPTHPVLLDHLADQFVRDGWSVKRLIRTLVLSSAYRMASKHGGAGDRADPENRLVHRARVRRLQGEAIRDVMLALSGRLSPTLFGPPVAVHLTEFLDGRGRPASGPIDGAGRRSVYLAVRRNFLSPMLLAFDTPSPFSTVGRRTVSNVPAQSLILLNNPFVHQQARRWARQVLVGGGSTRERINTMYLAAFGRPPSADEASACLEFVGGGKANDPAAWADLAHVLFNVKEFIFLN
jgi:hypothetical protein